MEGVGPGAGGGSGAGVSEFERDDSLTEVKPKVRRWETIGRDPINIYVSRLTSECRIIRNEASINSIDKPGVRVAPSEIVGLVQSEDGRRLVCRVMQEP